MNHIFLIVRNVENENSLNRHKQYDFLYTLEKISSYEHKAGYPINFLRHFHEDDFA